MLAYLQRLLAAIPRGTPDATALFPYLRDNDNPLLRDLRTATLAQMSAALGGSGGGTASGAGDFSATQLATLEAQAVTYGDTVVRRSTALHQPTEGLVLWIVYGQSLSASWESWPALSTTSTPPDCYMMGQSVHPIGATSPAWLPVGGSAALTPLVATVRDNASGLLTPQQVALLTNESNRGESPCEGFAAQLRPAWLRARGKPAGDSTNKWVFASCGVPGKSVLELSPGATVDLFQRVRDAITLAKAQATTLGVSFSVGGILYNQGEDDNAGLYSDYYTNLTALFNSIRTYVATATSQAGLLPIWLQQTGGQFASDTQELSVQRAQIAVARDMAGVYVVSGNQAVTDKGGHLTSNGTRWYGCMMGKVAAKTLIDGEGWECTRPLAWTHTGRTLLGVFHTPRPSLRFATPYLGLVPVALTADAGVYAADGTGVLALSNARMVAPHILALDMPRNAVGSMKVWLGRKATVNGAISIGDSDTTRLAYPYVYTAGSGQYTAENIAELLNLTYPSTNFSLADVQTSTPA